MPQCFAVPENAFQFEIWHIFLDFSLFLTFFLISAFLVLLTIFFVKNQLMWQLLVDNSYTQGLFLPRFNSVFENCTYADQILVVFSDFRQFFVCILVVIARNSLFVQHEGL